MWEIPYSWGSMIYAIGFNTLYWLYLVYLYCALVAWAFLERYFEWFANILGVTLGFAWTFTEWFFETLYRTTYFIFKYTIIMGIQGLIELSWDSLVWIYETSIDLFWWAIDVIEWLWEFFLDSLQWMWEFFVDSLQWMWDFFVDSLQWMWDTFVSFM